jgi:hypothetical protein
VCFEARIFLIHPEFHCISPKFQIIIPDSYIFLAWRISVIFIEKFFYIALGALGNTPLAFQNSNLFLHDRRTEDKENKTKGKNARAVFAAVLLPDFDALYYKMTPKTQNNCSIQGKN